MVGTRWRWVVRVAGLATTCVFLSGAPPGRSPGQHASPPLGQDYMAWVLASVVDLETDGRCGGARRVFFAGEDEEARAAYWDVACRDGGFAFRLQFHNEPERPVFLDRCEALARLTRSRCFRPLGGRRT